MGIIGLISCISVIGGRVVIFVVGGDVDIVIYKGLEISYMIFFSCNVSKCYVSWVGDICKKV